MVQRYQQRGYGQGLYCVRAGRFLVAGIFLLACVAAASAQTSTSPSQSAQTAEHGLPTLMRRPAATARRVIPGADSTLAFLPDPSAILPPPVQLVVEKGVPLRVMLKKPLPIKKVGEPIRAYVTEPVYAFDRVVVPKGSEVDGHVVRLAPPSKLKRMEAYLNADFSPHRTFKVEFDALILKDGTRIPLHTKVLPDPGPVVKLETNPAKAGAVRRARGLISQQYHYVLAMAKPSALWHRAKAFVWGQLPYHKQQLAAGTVFVAELEQPVDFGAVLIPEAEMGAMGHLPAMNDVAYARLETPLSSATAHLGTPVDAVLTRPVFSSKKRLLLPVGTELQGIVVRARPALRLHRNGQLHFTLQRVQLPSSTPRPVEMALEGIEVPKAAHVKLDEEGGTSIASNKESRVLKTALSLAIATSTLDGDHEHNQTSSTGDPSNRAAAGASGYRLVGIALSLGIQSRAFGQVMGFWGASQSVYFHFIACGRNLVLPKDTPMEISFGQHLRPSGS